MGERQKSAPLLFSDGVQECSGVNAHIKNHLPVGLVRPEFSSYFVSCGDVATKACEEDVLGCDSHDAFAKVCFERPMR